MDLELERWLESHVEDVVKALEEQERIAGAWPDVFPYAEDDTAEAAD
jgi:hypothetical protein